MIPDRGPVAIPPAAVRLLALDADVPESQMRAALPHYRPSEQALIVRLVARGMAGAPPTVPPAARRALAEAGFHIEEEGAA